MASKDSKPDNLVEYEPGMVVKYIPPFVDGSISKALNDLGARFDVKEVKQRTQGGRKLDYISIDATINRLNNVLGAAWSVHENHVMLQQLGDGKFLATVSLTLEALNKQALGVGADVATDADKALKTALAEALKKAGHQFGVGLYLWNEDEREIVARDRAAASGDLSALKAKAFEVALDRGAKPNAESVAETLGIAVEDLQDAGKLRTVLGV